MAVAPTWTLGGYVKYFCDVKMNLKCFYFLYLHLYWMGVCVIMVRLWKSVKTVTTHLSRWCAAKSLIKWAGHPCLRVPSCSELRSIHASFSFPSLLWIYFIFSHTTAPEACFTHSGGVCCVKLSLCYWYDCVCCLLGHINSKPTVRSANRQLIATLVTGHIAELRCPGSAGSNI